MTKSKRVMRRLILSKLYEHLEDRCSIDYPRDTFISGDLTMHDLDALLAFKSDAHLDELRNALDRLEAGSFGICLSCKSLISQEVLNEDPAQRVCDTCEQKFVHVAVGQLYHQHVTT